MSDTPRTDAAAQLVRATENGVLVHANFARELERENAALREELEVEKKRSSYWNDFAENATVLNAQLRADKDRLDWLLDNISPDSVLFNVNPAEDSMSEGAPDPWRAAIDTARKRAKP